MKYNIRSLGLFTLVVLTVISGCTGINTFPTIARPGDTISLMAGGSAKARKDNVSVKLTDATGHVFDLKALGLVRSVFNLRSDGRAVGMHYSSYLDSVNPWWYGHEPLQTVLVTDIPAAAATGTAALTVGLSGIDDNSAAAGSGSSSFSVSMEIIPGLGTSEQFLTSHSGTNTPANFGRLETAPNALISFGAGSTLIGAVSMAIDFDETAVHPNDLNVYVPESTVRGSFSDAGAFGKTQRMVYWHQDGQKIYVDIISPQGIDPSFLKFYIVHPKGLVASPAFNILSAQVYGTDGNPIGVIPTLTYSP